jgi:YfiR/HmsC-like
MQSSRKIRNAALRWGGLPGSLAISAVGHKRGAINHIATILAVTVLGLSLFVAPTAVQAQQVTTIDREYTIKAAFLYHFLTYIDWPEGTFADSKQPFVIGIYQTDPFGAVLDKIASTKNVEGRPIEIRRLNSTDKLLECHIVFMAGTVEAALQHSVLGLLSNSHVLCVGETEDFVEQGGAAQFFVEGNKVRFAFNTDVVDRSNLKVSSKLLSLAKIVSTR